MATATPTAGPWHTQIRSGGEAVAWVIDEFMSEASGIPIQDYDARLITFDTLEQFLGMIDTTRSPDTPVWIVGIVTDGPSPMALPPETEATPLPQQDVTGAYFALTANDGLLVTSGPLFDANSTRGPKYSDLLALDNEPLIIVTPSPYPTYGPPPGHTPDN
jgi:hypothetical protein